MDFAKRSAHLRVDGHGRRCQWARTLPIPEVAQIMASAIEPRTNGVDDPGASSHRLAL